MSTYSRFSKTDSVLFDGCSTYGRWNSPITEQILNSANAYIVNSPYAGRPDLIANVIYGNASLDWLLIAVNNVTETLNWPKAGDTILVPSALTVSSELI